MSLIVSYLRHVSSVLFGLLATVTVFYGILLDYNIADFGGPLVELPLLICSLLLLACNEAFQVGVLGIHHMTEERIESMGYSRAAKVHRLMFSTCEGQLKRLLIGQSFLVVCCSFTIAQLTTFAYFPTNEILGVSFGKQSLLFHVLVKSGLPGVILTVTIAQLLPSMLAKEYPLVCLDIPGIYSIIRLALAIEQIGIVKFVFLLFDWLNRSMFAAHTTSFSGDDAESLLSSPSQASIPSSSGKCGYNYSIRLMQYMVSTLITIASLCFVLYSMSQNYGVLSPSLPLSAQIILLLSTLVVVFYCEGLKVAVVSTTHLPPHHPDLIMGSSKLTVKGSGVYQAPGTVRADRVHFLLNGHSYKLTALPSSCEAPTDTKKEANPEKRDDNNVIEEDRVKRFLLGRQMIVVPLGFLVAQLTHFSAFPKDSPYMPPSLYYPIVSVGIPGILILLQFAQLTPQLLAENNPIVFMNMRGCYALAYLALSIERLGITDCAWVLYWIIASIRPAAHDKQEHFLASTGV